MTDDTEMTEKHREINGWEGWQITQIGDGHIHGRKEKNKGGWMDGCA